MVSVIENENEIVFFFSSIFCLVLFFSMQVMGEKGDDDVSFEVTISSKLIWINQFSTRILVKQIILL